MSVFRVFLVRIQSECGKIRTIKTPKTDTFHAVPISCQCSNLFQCFPLFCNVSQGITRICSITKDVLKNFTKFIGKHLCQSLFLNKFAGLRPATLSKKRLTQVFTCECCEIFKNAFFTEHLRTNASQSINNSGYWLLKSCLRQLHL